MSAELWQENDQSMNRLETTHLLVCVGSYWYLKNQLSTYIYAVKFSFFFELRVTNLNCFYVETSWKFEKKWQKVNKEQLLVNFATHINCRLKNAH